jgi:hypothetical protein
VLLGSLLATLLGGVLLGDLLGDLLGGVLLGDDLLGSSSSSSDFTGYSRKND